MLAKTFVATVVMAMGALGAVQLTYAADGNPLDPNYQAKMSQLRGDYFDLLKNLDKNHDGLISEEEYCSKAGEDPLSPAYKKRSAEFKAMMAKMDANKDGKMCLEEYMAEANPLHPSHQKK
jgi:EF hand